MPIINGQGRIGVRVQVPLLLDTYTGAAAAYSLRKLTNTYNGPAIRVRRSSNNAELNIGFNSDGTLDTTTLLSFVGAGDGFLVTWYDQSGNGRNASHSWAAYQSKIVSNGVVETSNGTPAINTMSGLGFAETSSYFNYSSLVVIAESVYNSGTTNYNIITNGGYDYVSMNSSTNNSAKIYKHPAATVTPKSPNAMSGEVTLYLSGSTHGRNILYFNIVSDKAYASFNGNQTSMMQDITWQQKHGWFGAGNSGRQLFHGSALWYNDQKFHGKVQELVLWNQDTTSYKTGLINNINTYYSIYSPMDSDAQAFITAASITDSTQASAVNTLVTSLKSAGIWTKMKAIYPFVGGTASSHKFNLKDPRDLDAAYRLVFNGGWTHSSTGADPNGTNGYADTFVANNLIAQNDVSIGVYLGEDNPGDAQSTCAIGSYNAGLGTCIYPGNNVQNSFFSINNSNVTGYFNTDLKSRGFYLISKTSSSAFYSIRGNITNTTFTPNTYITTSFKLGKIGEYNGDYNAQQQRFAYIGDGLSSAEASAFYTAVQAFQTTLGRQV